MAEGIDKVKEALLEILEFTQSEKLWNRIGLAQERNIKKRTTRGIDLLGNVFKPYNEKYARRKYRETGINAHVVNLIFNPINGMMDSIDHKVLEGNAGVEIFFTNEQKNRLAEIHHALGAGKSKVIRKFWGVNKDDDDSFKQILTDEIDLILEKFSEE